LDRCSSFPEGIHITHCKSTSPIFYCFLFIFFFKLIIAKCVFEIGGSVFFCHLLWRFAVCRVFLSFGETHRFFPIIGQFDTTFNAVYFPAMY
jgi:hypothetical protein